MIELALFAGAGGGILGGHLLRWRTVCAVERDAYAAQVLAQRQNDGLLPPFPVWSDVCSFDGRPWRGLVDVVSGGFPCQDIAVCGNGAGIEGTRSGLWKHMGRIIDEVRPRFAWLENSPCSSAEALPWSSVTLPKWGMTRSGIVYQRRNAARRIVATGSGSWPTPVASMAKGSSPASLIRKSGRDRSRDRLDHAVMALHGGPLNPEWVEWLMGWPIGWTDLRPLGMGRFRL